MLISKKDVNSCWDDNWRFENWDVRFKLCFVFSERVWDWKCILFICFWKWDIDEEDICILFGWIFIYGIKVGGKIFVVLIYFLGNMLRCRVDIVFVEWK